MGRKWIPVLPLLIVVAVVAGCGQTTPAKIRAFTYTSTFVAAQTASSLMLSEGKLTPEELSRVAGVVEEVLGVLDAVDDPGQLYETAYPLVRVYIENAFTAEQAGLKQLSLMTVSQALVLAQQYADANPEFFADKQEYLELIRLGLRGAAAGMRSVALPA